MFIKVKIDNLNELSSEIPEIVSNDDKKNKEKIKIKTDKKYLLISTFFKNWYLKENSSLFIKTFFGLTCEIKFINWKFK